MSNSKELIQLIKDCAAGKTSAQARLYGLFAPKMFGVCMRYSKDQTEAEDNLQDGFMKVFEKIGTYKHQGSFEGWMRRVMVNVALAKFRKQNQLFPVDDLSNYDREDDDTEIDQSISGEALMKLIRELPPRYRMVFNLYVLEAMSHREIAEELHISEGTSKSNLARARMILRDRIRKELMDAEKNFTA
ncbi:RNA polymerase sigma factor [Mangrovibacterium marinum]|uniref:RNA polymerase sigma-70 factor (ECF subfamily) n=1 Tax=Mangrovibacterium marinum TaxID=1639118 RepID=A0A2T5C213_9BACT|nr:sigma-70 family RNA polymerase sigma factor [Mangrovibacterium marinum]PTN08732.1 RNA polymerase sigma-70 factor (ECF subfamily) [Mangrovibacterium marinum]